MKLYPHSTDEGHSSCFSLSGTEMDAEWTDNNTHQVHWTIANWVCSKLQLIVQLTIPNHNFPARSCWKNTKSSRKWSDSPCGMVHHSLQCCWSSTELENHVSKLKEWKAVFSYSPSAIPLARFSLWCSLLLLVSQSSHKFTAYDMHLLVRLLNWQVVHLEAFSSAPGQYVQPIHTWRAQ